MKIKILKTLLQHLLIVGLIFSLNSCSNTAKNPNKAETKTTLNSSDVLPIYDEFNLILVMLYSSLTKLRLRSAKVLSGVRVDPPRHL